MKTVIWIPGYTPSKKNSKQIVRTPRGKYRLISSPQYLDWEKAALWELKRRYRDLIDYEWNYPLRAGFRYVRKGHYKFDYNNLNQGVLDVLVQAGIIADDDMKHIIPNGDLSYEVDKDGPGVLVILEEIGGQGKILQ